MPPVVRFGVLGALDVHRDGAPVTVGSLNQRRLLSALLVHSGSVVSADRLADIVWSGAPPPSAAASLQTYVSRLRALLGPEVILTRPPGYVLGKASVDADEFERLLREQSLEEAIAVWRGRPFAEFADHEWARPTVVRLEELHAVARELQVEVLLGSARVDEAVAAAEALCESEPFRERAHGLLMQALARQGRAAEALRAFDRFRGYLVEETGLEPSLAMTEIQRAVLAQDAQVSPSSRDSRSGNLPLQHSSFVGRVREVTELTALLSEARIVTLTGVGGVGKTRLAIRVAADVLPRFEHGAWLVELAGVRDPEVVVDAVAAVFGVAPRPEADLGETLTGFLRAKELLLVLDNCEHLLGAVVELVRALEGTCPRLVVLATSREGLAIAGERIVAVASLDLPRSSDRKAMMRSDAVRLFVERAIAVKSDFAVTDANASAIAEIVRRLDGIPLALELAAARVPVLSPMQLAQRLDQRFRLLSGGERGAIERHATLRAAIDWSYDLLALDQQLLLARLSVFVGGCSLEAVEAVCSASGIDEVDVLDLLSALVARSLVVVDDGPSGERRYRLLETIRQYAEEQLDTAEQAELRDRHAGFYVDFAETAARGLRGPHQLYWLLQVEPELENLRTAMAWTIANDDAVRAERFLSAAASAERGPLGALLLREAEAVLELPSIRTIERYPFALMAGALAAVSHGIWERAEQLCGKVLAATREPNDELAGWTATAQMNIARAAGDQRLAIEHQERALYHFRRVADPHHLVRVLMVLAVQRAGTGDSGIGADEAREALSIARQTGNPGLTSCALGGLAYVLADSEAERTRALIAKSLELNETLGGIVVDELALVFTIVASGILGERDQALRLSARALDRGLTAISRHCACLEVTAEALASEAPAAAAVLHGHLDTLDRHVGHGRGNRVHVTLRQRTTAVIDAQLDAALVSGLRTQGASMSEGEAAAYALDAIARVLKERGI
ncbi:MAG: BTAD domain-containing putative transcriptional regulator [Acidimicrobiales bacterium]